jgi:ABC-2 type transport system ATP-binding protein
MGRRLADCDADTVWQRRTRRQHGCDGRTPPRAAEACGRQTPEIASAPGARDGDTPAMRGGKQSSAPAVLEAIGLHKSFDGTPAVRGVDLVVRPGERVGLLGPNGAGKTTTLLMLLGAITPDAGTIDIGGHRLPRHRSKAMELVGFAAGYLPLPDRLRVREALDLFARLHGIRRTGPTIDGALERFRIPHLADRMCMELSSGQRTLVGICKAILGHPQLLVLDEPTASLDPDVARRVRSGLETLSRDEGTSLLITSHDMSEVERLCERVVFLASGRVVADGPPFEIAARFGHGDLEGLFLHLAGEDLRDFDPDVPELAPDEGALP